MKNLKIKFETNKGNKFSTIYANNIYLCMRLSFQHIMNQQWKYKNRMHKKIKLTTIKFRNTRLSVKYLRSIIVFLIVKCGSMFRISPSTLLTITFT